MNSKFALLSFLIAVSLLLPITMAQWTNITCVDGNAVKIYEGKLQGTDIIQNETEICGNRTCEEGSGCFSPGVGGELHLSVLLFLGIGSAVLGYFAMRIDHPDYTALRFLFFFLSFVMIMSGIWLINTLYYAVGYEDLGIATLGLLTTFFTIFVFLIWYLLIPIMKMIFRMFTGRKARRKSRGQNSEDEEDVF